MPASAKMLLADISMMGSDMSPSRQREGTGEVLAEGQLQVLCCLSGFVSFTGLLVSSHKYWVIVVRLFSFFK